MNLLKLRLKAFFIVFVSILFIIPLGITNAEEQKNPEAGDVNVVPIQVTGPAENRLNFVIFGDGYTADEMNKFHEDVDRNQNIQWSQEPFRSYRNHFNVYMVETPSEDSGVSYDPEDDNSHRDTALNIQFGSQDGPSDDLERRILFGSGGEEKLNEILKNDVAAELGISSDSQNIQSLTLANTSTYGGIGGKAATTSGGSSQGPLVSIHEIGHSLGGLQDDYPYYDRDEPGGRAPNVEPDSAHLTRMSSEEMKEQEAKWWNWLGEESVAGGTIRAADSDGYESGNYYQSNIWRSSNHSKMRAIAFNFDQVEREQMVHKISGLRDANEMPVESTPEGEVGSDDVLWVDTTHPRFYELDITWQINDEKVSDTHNNNHLKLTDLNVDKGDTIKVKIQDETEFVRKESLKEGPSMNQSREWTIGESLPENEVDVEFSNHSPTEYPLAKDEVVYVEAPHPTNHVMKVTWELSGEEIPNEHNSFNLNLDELDIPEGFSKLSATLTDPNSSFDETDTVTWTIDNGLPEAPKKLSDPLTKQTHGDKHNIYFNEFSMQLKPKDDQESYVVSEFQLDGDGWSNYYGFPEESLGSPFVFSHSGTDIKAITYGNLGTGGLTKTSFEQDYTGEDSGGPFEPGFGTHTIEHRAIDASGNIGGADKFKATVLPGELPDYTDTITGEYNDELVISEGIVHLKDAQVADGITIKEGASLVVHNSSIQNGLQSENAKQVQIVGSEVNGYSKIKKTTEDVTIAGTTFKDGLTLTENNQVSANEKYGEYGPILSGSSIEGSLASYGNNSKVEDFGSSNEVEGSKTEPDNDITAKRIKNTIDEFNEENFDDNGVIHSLKLHLTSVHHYEKKDANDKVIKHMKSFKKLLEYQKNEDLISESVYDNLNINADIMIDELE